MKWKVCAVLAVLMCWACGNEDNGVSAGASGSEFNEPEVTPENAQGGAAGAVTNMGDESIADESGQGGTENDAIEQDDVETMLPGGETGTSESEMNGPEEQANGEAGSEAGAGEMNGSGETELDPSLPLLDQLVVRVASQTCATIQNCCLGSEIDIFFGPIGYNPNLEDIRSQLPPMAPFDPDTCVSLLTTAYQRVPFGPWIDAVKAGYAEFNEAAAIECLEEMESVACGAPLAEVMFSGRCFGFSPPSNAEISRQAFRQTGVLGDACVALNDGVGGGFFGTCDPMVGACAYEDSSDGSRRLVSRARSEVGVCVPVKNENELCSLPTYEICRRGLSCVNDVCVPPITTPLSIGEGCYQDWQLQGNCQDSYCDLFGEQAVCVARKDVGVACGGPEECATGHCADGACAAGAFCDGAQ